MAVQKISNEQKAKIRRKSAATLPDNPSAAGWKPQDIRNALHKGITDSVDSLIGEIDRLAEEVNDEIDDVMDEIDQVEANANEELDKRYSIPDSSGSKDKIPVYSPEGEVVHREGDTAATPGTYAKRDVNGELRGQTPTAAGSDVLVNMGMLAGKLAEVGYSLDLLMDPNTYVLTLRLKNAAGTVISQQTVDLPLETMIVNIENDEETGKIVATLRNGQKSYFDPVEVFSNISAQERARWNGKIDGARITEDGYLVLTSGGEDVGDPLGPFAGEGGTGDTYWELGNGLYIEDNTEKHSAGSIVRIGVTTEEDYNWEKPVANGRGSINLGRGGVAGGQENFVDPDVPLDEDNHDYAFNIGKGNHNYGDSGFTQGRGVTNRGANGTAMGNGTTNNAKQGISTGKDTVNDKDAKNSFVGGEGSRNKKQCTFTHGYQCDNNGQFSALFGYKTKMSFDSGLVAGKYNEDFSEEEESTTPTQYTRNSNWQTSDDELYISTPQDLLQFAYLVDRGTTFAGKTIHLTKSLNLNPGWSALPTLSSNPGKGISSGSGSFTRPSSPLTKWTAFSYNGTASGYAPYFAGVFDGHGHTIKGIYNYKNSMQSRYFGMFLPKVAHGGVIKNLRVSNSYAEWDQAPSIDTSFGFVGCGEYGATLQNIFLDDDVTLVFHGTNTASKKYRIGGLVGWISSDDDVAKVDSCAFLGTIITCSGQGSREYPQRSDTNTYVGGVAASMQECGGEEILTNCYADATILTAETVQSDICGMVEPESGGGGGAQMVCPACKGVPVVEGNSFGAYPDGIPTGWKEVPEVGYYLPGDLVDSVFLQFVPAFQIGDGSSEMCHDAIFVGTRKPSGSTGKGEYVMKLGDTHMTEEQLRKMLPLTDDDKLSRKIALVAKQQIGADRTVVSVTIPRTDWVSVAGISPYTYYAKINPLDADMLELLNDQPVLFAEHGFALDDEETVYSIGLPNTSVTLEVLLHGPH